jgi:hypothetical protein
MAARKASTKELPAPPVGPVRWRVSIQSARSAVIFIRYESHHVLARTAFDAWRESPFYNRGCAFSDVVCEQDSETAKKSK